MSARLWWSAFAGSKRTAVPEQLFGAGPQPLIPLVHRGPLLVVIHTSSRLSECGSATSMPRPVGTVANAPSRRPSLSGNSSSTVRLPQAHAGHSEMNEPRRETTACRALSTRGDDLVRP